MQDAKMQKAIEHFILRRINDCGMRGSESVDKAYEILEDCSEKLRNKLNSEQQELFLECENAFALVDGELMQCYYRAGFSDAIKFLMGWRDGEWN